PNLTILFDLEPKKGLSRIASNKDRERNRLDLETISFHEKVYKGYQILLDKFPNRIQSVNADQPLEQVGKEVLNKILLYIKK
ncbi:dTMP kinase, partial [Staphylococcus epidermidis]